jgi:TPR repeat protein
MKIKIAQLVIITIFYTTNATADLESGLVAMKKKEYKTAAKEFELAAKEGMPTAQHLLGRLYAEGNGVDKSYDKALVWYRKSANQGNGNSMEEIANFYANGYGVKQDMLALCDF